VLNEKLLKATMKEKNELDDNEDDDSVEGDYPHIKLEDLLSELQIKDDKEEGGEGDEGENEDEGEDEWEDEEEKVESAAKKKNKK
jgi:hypothetical protein